MDTRPTLMILTPRIHRRRHASPLLCVLAIALGGCSLTPVYQRPQTALPPTLGASTAVAAAGHDTATTAVAALNQEEQQFVHAFSPQHDLTPLVTQALAHSPDFRNSVLLVQQARAQYRIERAQQLPQLGINAQGVRHSYDNPATQERYGQKLFTTAVGVNGFELDLFGKLASLSAAAQQRYLASRQGQQAARGALIAEVLRAYTVERAAAQAEQRLQASAEHTSALQAIANRQHEVGLLSTDTLNQQRHECDQARIRALQAGSDHAAARRALQLLTGYTAPDNTGTLQSLLPEAGSANAAAWRELDSQVLLQRPDIQQAEAELHARNADIGAARAAFFPSIQLSTSLGTASDSLNGLFMPGSRSWSFMPQLLMPIFGAVWLDHIVVGTVTQRAELFRLIAHRSDHDHWRIAAAADRGQHLGTAEYGQHDVQQDQIRLPLRMQRHRLLAILGHRNVETIPAQVGLEDAGAVRIVFDQQDLLCMHEMDPFMES